ncbi:MAG: hypothetical protein EP298_10635 [Gammaproteobacteria bacterium]|nr:MAG: hypothetical protein EP298_10635 [Gammaproteobacteria bacterium]UTW42225.1 hypothetical protein KFE69_12150 [bacterium SCSIO 12844]
MNTKKDTKKRLQSINTLIDKTSFLHQIAKRSENINKAQQLLDNVNFALLSNTRVLNYEDSKLLLGTESQSIIARFYMQRSEILKLLRQKREFCDLLSIELKLFIEPMAKVEKLIPPKRDDIPDNISYKASKTLSQLCKQTKTPKIQESLTKFLAKHGKFKTDND